MSEIIGFLTDAPERTVDVTVENHGIDEDFITYEENEDGNFIPKSHFVMSSDGKKMWTAIISLCWYCWLRGEEVCNIKMRDVVDTRRVAIRNGLRVGGDCFT